MKKTIKEYLLITFGAVVAAAAIYFFMLPSHVAIGSGSALAMVLSNFIPLPVSVISLSLNIIFLILGFGKNLLIFQIRRHGIENDIVGKIQNFLKCSR